MKTIKIFCNISIKSLLLIFSVAIVVASCHKVIRHRSYIIKVGKKGYYSIANRAKGVKADIQSYVNTNISSVTVEEALFLEDLEINFQKRKGQTVAVGRKFYINNKITTDLLSWDRTDLMGKIGVCRARQTTTLADLLDDGIINGSAKALCLKQFGARKFKKGKIKFTESSYSLLSDWHGDDFKDALYAFLQSCTAFKENKPVQSGTFSIGNEANWRELCNIGKQYYKAGYEKMFFERYFSPFKITKTNGESTGKFTGYYLWELPISLTRNEKYWYPIYTMPAECKLAKRCPSRNEINSGALDGRGLEIGWASNPMDVYFMQMQGSGIGVTEDGKQYKFVYAGHNNMKFIPYSEFIKKNPKFCPVKGYGKTIEWLNAEPEKALKATSISDNYVFFQRKSGLEPIVGAQGTPLTQSRSIAVDPKYIPYGVPMWIQTNVAVIDSDNHNDKKWINWNRLYIAQDTGSAIKGVIRADLYMGHGKKGEFIAKNQNFSGTWYMLIPNSLVDKIR
jgi:membrane-bound lytic murein transglycosylase A